MTPTSMTARVSGIPFKNDDTHDLEKLNKAFLPHGRKVELMQRELHMWIWVVCDDGSLWLLDKSHGGGGIFKLQKS